MGFYYNVTGNETAAMMYLLFQLMPSIIGIVGYVFLSLGLYTIAQRRGLPNPWLAWIPVANVWIIGSISDQYQQVVKKKKTNRRKVLLWLGIVMYVVYIAFVVVMFVMIFQIGMAGSDLYPDYYPYDYISYAADSEAELMNALMNFLLWVMLMGLVASVVSIIYLVFWCMSFYDIYSSCDPKNATLFTVLSILVSIVAPYLVFAVRNKDLGMYPPQQPQWGQPGGYPPQQPYYQPYQPPVQQYQPPAPHYQPPTPYYQPPVQQYQPPIQPAQPPVQPVQPPAQPPVPPQEPIE